MFTILHTNRIRPHNFLTTGGDMTHGNIIYVADQTKYFSSGGIYRAANIDLTETDQLVTYLAFE